jgi:hypothetical protein
MSLLAKTCQVMLGKSMSSGSNVNVGEWVEVDHCYSIGICSAGGIAIVTKFESGKADIRYLNSHPNSNPNSYPNPVPNPNLNPSHRYVLDGKIEHAISIDRLTTIPMPHRGTKATLRDRHVRVEFVTAVEKSVYERMSSIDLLKWGLQFKRNVKRGWLMDLLLREKILDDSKEAKNDRLWKDYLAQQVFIEGMQAALGDDFDPRASKQGRKENGDFDTNKNGVPQNLVMK